MDATHVFGVHAKPFPLFRKVAETRGAAAGLPMME
jgi:hypothetical protein